MSKGYVYILSNSSMPGILKIGKTTRTVEQRCNELWQTGVPTPFAVVDQVLSPNCSELEEWMHERFIDARVSASREFFAVTEDQATAALGDLLREQVYGLIQEFTPDLELVDMGLGLDEISLYTMAAWLDVDAREVVSAMNFLLPDELRPALERYQAKVQERAEARAAGLDMPSLVVDIRAYMQ